VSVKALKNTLIKLLTLLKEIGISIEKELVGAFLLSGL